jgi:hypothetical protein
VVTPENGQREEPPVVVVGQWRRLAGFGNRPGRAKDLMLGGRGRGRRDRGGGADSCFFWAEEEDWDGLRCESEALRFVLVGAFLFGCCGGRGLRLHGAGGGATDVGA